MTQSLRLTTALSISLFALQAPAFAQTLLSGDHSVDGSLCVGDQCTNSIVFGGVDLLIREVDPELMFQDTSTTTGFPTRDWRILTNEDGVDNFIIEDVDADRDVVVIEGAAPANSLYVTDSGAVGLGTSIPMASLHIARSFPNLRYESTAASPNYVWDIFANQFNYYVSDTTNSTIPFVIQSGAPDFAMYLTREGDLGLGTSDPDGQLHTQGSGVQLAYFESTDGGPVQVRFRTDSENRRFLATNNADEVQSQIIFGDDEIKFTGETDSGANLWLTIGPSGIISQGPTCGSPCDLTFDPDHFSVPPIAERAAYMWDNMHLPAIGPTSPDTPINLTEKVGGVIHELEVAHIYIEQLHEQQAADTARIDAQHIQLSQQAELISRLSARLEALEAK